jgi:serine/threonine protein kinase/formylglycine-generating enzyme required for sulfatase activity
MAIDPARAKSLFLAASDITDSTERDAYLDRECGGDAELRARVEVLLRANDAAPLPAAPGATVDSAPGQPRTEDYPDSSARVGVVLAGKYKLIEEIGEGGMGSVFMAQQTQPVKRAVAVKVIKAGMDSKAVLARFEAERQALAMMDHPNIAKVLDAGFTGATSQMSGVRNQELQLGVGPLTADVCRLTPDVGRPFFVMELIKGTPITRYCDEHKLTPRQRLELFIPVCQAIQHAHQKGIIHRDIKPSNVLVALYDDRPVPKVIDFGVAKAAGQALTDKTLMTGFGAMVGTPEYMSPEQASLNNLDIDTRSDVYSLGVLLYELLTGTTPVDKKSLGKAAVLEILRIVREVEAPRPSAKLSTIDTLPSVAANRGTEPAKLSRLMKGELDWLVLKALEKDRTRRYETANALSRDIQRYLADEVVEARPPTVGYRVKKFVRRHKGQVIAASLVVLALVGGIVGTTLGLFEAQRQEKIARDRQEKAQQEADKATKARDFLVSIFRIKDIQAGNTTTARQIVNQAEHRIPIEFAGQPELRDELLAAIADVNRSLDRTIPAAMILEARGAIQLHSSRGISVRPSPQTLLYPDDRLALAADAQVQLVFLSDLHKERLQSGREATIGRKGCSPTDAVRERAEDVLMTFVRLPKGTFYMGWNGMPSSAKKTEIQEDIEIAVHDVTQGQWEAIMGNNPSWFSRKGGGRGHVVDISDEELKFFPVEKVSWDDALAFIKKLNEKYRGSGYVYRLPSDAEWEYACRGGATSLEECSYQFYLDKPTNDLSSEQANFDGGYPFGKAPKGKYLERPTRVGAYPPNKLGLCDMHGNLGQWTDSAEGAARLIRGGCWSLHASNCAAACRYEYEPASRDYDLGFRLARVPVR